MRKSRFHAEQTQRIFLNYENVVMDAIKYTSKAVLPADRSMLSIIFIKFGPEVKSTQKREISQNFIEISQKFHRICFLCIRKHASHRHFQNINPLLLPVPTFSAVPFSVGPWGFQSLHMKLCSFALKLSTQKNLIDATFRLFALVLIAISRKFTTHVMWHWPF